MSENIEIINPNQENRLPSLGRRVLLGRIVPAALSLLLLSNGVKVFADTIPENKGEPTPPPTEEPTPIPQTPPERPKPPVYIPPKPAPPPPQPPRSPFAEVRQKLEMISNEKSAWKQVLGADVDVPDIPPAFYPAEVRQKLEYYGLALRYIPALNLGTIDDLIKLGTSTFLDSLQGRYPNWAHYERLNESEKRDYRKSRNLDEWFWESVKNKNINFPNLSGQWIAVEKMAKPAYKSNYEKTPMGVRLGFKDRFNVPGYAVNSAVDREKEGILGDIGFRSGADLRMPEALEWNLMANREGWGKTNTYEQTNTEWPGSGGSYYNHPGDTHRIFVGDADYGGAAASYGSDIGSSGNYLGFRLVVYLDT